MSTNKLKRLKEWMLESNRWKHFVGVMAVSLIGTLLMGVGCIGGMEFKDVHHTNGDGKPLKEWSWNAWDWKDVWAGLAGGVLGQAGQIIIIVVIKNIIL